MHVRILSALVCALLMTMPAGAQVNNVKKVFVIVMENHNWSQFRGAANAPYINNTLLPQASHAEQYYNPPSLHPSLPNYLWLEAGTNFGILNDSDPSINHQSTTAHLVTQLKNAGVSWKTYQEDISGTNCPLTSVNKYAPKHNPFVYFDDVTNTNDSNSAYCIAHVRPFTEMAADLQNNTVAQYVFITPNLCDDGHDSCGPVNDPIRQTDNWLAAHVPAIINSTAYQRGGALFITWDEGEGGDGPIGMIVLSPYAKGGGYSNSIHYTHGSLLRTVEEIFGVSLLGDAAVQTDLSDLFSNNADTNAPTVSITAPTGGSNVSGTITVSATASDNVGVAGVQFRLDGAALGSEDTTSPYSVSWNTTTVSNGSHSLTAVARDAAGNQTTSAAITVTVNNTDTTAPTVSITAPTGGSNVSGTTTVSATASDNVGVAGVQFRLDGAALGSEDTTSPHSVSWNTTTVSNGSHSLTAVARDAAGNQTTSAAITVTVNNTDTTAPTVSITAPTGGSNVSGTTTVSATASDNVGVAGVQFRLDGAALGSEDTTSPYSVSWNTTTVSNGSHSLTAVARDAAGNQTTSAAIAVTVNNTSPDTTAPTVSMTAPSSGATVSGTMTVTASASDNVGVVGVQFKLDGANLGAEITVAPYSISWNTTTSSNGTHNLTTVARDAAGNQAISAPVLVT